MTERKDEDLERIDKALEGLARDDAPERLVQDTLKKVRDSQTAEHVPYRLRDQRWAGGIAAAVVAFSALGIVLQQFDYQDVISFQESKFQTPDTAAGTAQGLGPQRAGDELLGGEGELKIRGARRAEDVEAEEIRELNRKGSTGAVSGRLETPPAAALTPMPDPSYRRDAGTRETAKVDGGGDDYREQRRQALPELPVTSFPIRKHRSETSAAITSTSEIIAAKPKSRGNEGVDNLKNEVQGQSAITDDVAWGFNNQGEPANGATSMAELDAANRLLDYDHRFGAGNFNSRLAPDGRIAERFLARYRNLDGLVYQQPTGYWANSYVPGDPAMRRLEAQLRSQYPQALTTTLERNAQPFDAPVNAALGVTLHATQTAVDGPTRVQVQVGLKAAERQGGRRLPMNVAVVLDLPEIVDVSVAQQVRALLMALNEQHQTGDRFSITAAGVPGGVVVQPDDYRHGTVVSFIEHLVNGQLAGDTLDLVDALVTAVDCLARNDDPNAVLGSSLVLLVTADGTDPQTQDGLEILAHQSAVAGMSVSVVTLAGVNGSDLEAVALAGQGRLRALGAPADAAPLIDRELHSASRTVARAIRLRIQLMPGVRLVDVIGSYRLDELVAERVREAEQSIDARLSRTWGIDADRDEDEDGIQIVIPGMAAGEHHVVLLDVVVDGPGTVADVRVRYKDLVQMNNGVARASLSLADANTTRLVQGPLERNLLKNLVAFEVAQAARRSGRNLANGDASAARTELMNALTLIAGLRQRVAGWESDAELQADEQRLTRFVNQLDAGQTDMLIAALEYAAYRKLLPATSNEH